MNIGGASDRPVPADIWNVVREKLDKPEIADDPVDYTRLRRRGNCSVCSIQ